jgi:hypothetical protein
VALSELGAEYLILDTYQGEPASLHDLPAHRQPIERLLEQVIDAPGESLR